MKKIHEKPGPWLFFGPHSSCCGINVMTALPTVQYTTYGNGSTEYVHFYGSHSEEFPREPGQYYWRPEVFDPNLIDEAKTAKLGAVPFSAWHGYFRSASGMMTLRKLRAEEDVPDGFRVIATWPTGERLVTNAAEA